ncbi:MAG: hypothetical protein ACXVGH_13485, partial [Mycobacteriales bacterium]
MSAEPADGHSRAGRLVVLPPPGSDEQLRTVTSLLDASYRLSRTRGTAEAADVVADSACELTGADGAHVYLPEQLGGAVWSNANEARTSAGRG